MILTPDGDAAFLRVNNRLPVHALKPGEVAAATNTRFDEGKPRPRFGIALEQWGQVGGGEFSTMAYSRFSDPNGFDNGVLITNDWRDGDGEDGGRGRAYRICPGNVPQEISLNGHDVWGGCRLKQAHHSMFLARHGNERHYFSAAAVDGANDRIQLNCAPNWADGELVLYQAEADSEIIPGPNPNAEYYVKTDGSNRVTLHGTKADAVAGTNTIALGTAVGRFYLERQADAPGPFGNGAPPLILQPTETLSAFENGFRAVTKAVAVTNSNDDDDTITAPSHRLLAGDQVSVVLSTDGTLTKYARPVSDHLVKLYDTEANALAGTATGLLDVSADAQTGTIAKAGAAALPMPPLREIAYYKGRIVGVVNGTRDTIVVSDPFDFLHYSIFTGPVPANMGEAGEVQWLLPLGEDTLLIGKETAVLAITGLSSSDSGNWRMEDVTREYGAVAPLAALNVGADGQFLSRKGWASVIRTVAGEKLGQARTVSQDIPEYFKDIDWRYAGQSCAETWNNRLFLSVPVKGQTGPVKNNRTLVSNFLNQSLTVEQSVLGDQLVGRVSESGMMLDAWEGEWTGELLNPVAFCKLKVAGEERLTFATPDGFICWFTDGFVDGEDAVEMSVTTRGYFGGARVLALKAAVNWDTHNPKLSVTARTAGHNEADALLEELTFDQTKYLVSGAEDYDPETSTEAQFDAPHREDYALSASELLVGKLDVHQNMTENMRLRTRDRAPQLVIENTQGSVRINSVTLLAKPAGTRATRTT